MAIDAVEQVSLLLRIPDDSLRKVIVQSILGFWEARPIEADIRRVNNPAGKERNFEVRSCSQDFQQHVIEKSKVVETLVQAMGLLNHGGQLRQSVLVVLEKLTRYSEPNSASFTQARGAEYVALSVSEATKTGLPIVIDLLWNAMEHGPTELVIEQMSTLTSVSSMHCAFNKLMKSSTSIADKEIRNDLLVLFIHLAKSNPAAPFVETNFLSDIIEFGYVKSVIRTISNFPFQMLSGTKPDKVVSRF